MRCGQRREVAGHGGGTRAVDNAVKCHKFFLRVKPLLYLQRAALVLESYRVAFCRDREGTAPASPNQNGKVERFTAPSGPTSSRWRARSPACRRRRTRSAPGCISTTLTVRIRAWTRPRRSRPRSGSRLSRTSSGTCLGSLRRSTAGPCSAAAPSQPAARACRRHAPSPGGARARSQPAGRHRVHERCPRRARSHRPVHRRLEGS